METLCRRCCSIDCFIFEQNLIKRFLKSEMFFTFSSFIILLKKRWDFAALAHIYIFLLKTFFLQNIDISFSFWNYSQTSVNDHVRTTTTCLQRLFVWGPNFNFCNFNNDHLSTKATNFGSVGCTGLTAPLFSFNLDCFNSLA